MGKRDIKGVFILLTLCVAGLLDAKTLRKRQDVSIREFPPQGSFSRAAVESSPIPSPKSAALRVATGNDEIGSRRLPLRAAVESMPAKYERAEAISFRIPMRDAVERRPPAYDDDLFALTDELESLGIDPWTIKKKPGKKPEKIEDSDSPHNYVIQLPPKDRVEYSQLHQNSDHTRMNAGLKNAYYGAAKPYNNNDAWSQHYAAYQPMYRLQ